MKKTGWGLLLAVAAALGQTQAPASKPEFEVASIRPAAPLDKMVASGKMHVGMHVDGARVDIGAMAIPELIQLAYKVKRFQVTGAGADGISAQRFDILAKLPEGATKDQVPEMLQALLADRFKLKIHKETKDQNVYVLLVGKGGPKLKEAADDPPPSADAEAPKSDGQVQLQMNDGGRGAVVRGGPNGDTKVTMSNGGIHFSMEKMPITQLIDFLARFLDRPIVDMTDLKGKYQVSLDLTMDDIRNIARSAGVMVPGPGPAGVPGAEAGRGPADAASDPSGSSIFSSIQQLGLKLEPRKAPLEMIVVDHVEKMPTEN
jgi:uncharacterized protein (TIGR03435 family)